MVKPFLDVRTRAKVEVTMDTTSRNELAAIRILMLSGHGSMELSEMLRCLYRIHWCVPVLAPCRSVPKIIFHPY